MTKVITGSGMPQIDPTKELPEANQVIEEGDAALPPVDPTITDKNIDETKNYSVLDKVMNQYLEKDEDKKDESENDNNEEGDPAEKDKDVTNKADNEESGDGGNKDPDKGSEERPSKLEEMSQEQLIEELKKNQRIANERLDELKKLKDSPITNDEELKAFIEELKKNPINAWKNYRDKFKLPDTDLLKASLSNDPEEQLLAWQNTTLKKKFEKEFGLQDGEFEVVKEDLYTPKTPSFRWRQLSEQKEKELFSRVEDIQKEEKDRIEKIRESQEEDIEYFAETFLDGDLEVARSKVQELNSIPQKIADGELDQSQHPFSLRNLMRGAFYEELVTKERERAEQNIIKQFNEKGYYLTSKELPTNLNNIPQGKGETVVDLGVNEDIMKISPMYRTMFQDIGGNSKNK